MLDYLISTFIQLNNDEFSSIIEEIINSHKINICIQRKLLDHLIPTFFQLNDDDFSFRVKKIFESREMNTCIQRKRIEIFLQVCNLSDQQILDALSLFEAMTYPRGSNKGEIISTYLQKKAREFVDASFYKPKSTINLLELKNKNLKYKIQGLKRNKFTTNALLRLFSIKVARAKTLKQRQISKIPADISNIGQTSICATVECTKIIYQFLTREMPQHWSIVVYQQQLEGLFNRYDIKVHPNMDPQLQESRIQLSISDSRVQNISQEML
ncbi:10792_t:CDS:2 [Dentiscutata erythropus]|uniref:10792_t:CDS:1 n=1 Tax=Dentiscutata erythropus TaxID=1348616 RepID=A0A9N9CF98_9GLOM|nr:10792_t:CDS:2 [Dentiscutata erythropus]